MNSKPGSYRTLLFDSFSVKLNFLIPESKIAKRTVWMIRLVLRNVSKNTLIERGLDSSD